MNKKNSKFLAFNGLASAVMIASMATGSVAQAAEIYNKDGKTLEFNVEGMAGVFSTDENYTGTPGDKDWQEAYLKGDLVGRSTMENGASVYGGLGVIGLGTWGDGDAGGLTNGSERELKIENAFVGWQSSDGLFDLSVGRQQFMLGDGFIIAGDAISAGAPLPTADRGGAYYLAAQKSFDKTAILKIDPEGPIRGDLFWLQSDNPYHQDTELAGINVEFVDDAKGTLGLSYMSVLDVEANTGLSAWNQRDGMDVISLRGQGSMGVENLFLSFEYVDESGGDTATKIDANAWYVEAGWTFSDIAWSPTINYRHAEFSGDDSSTATTNEAFDPLFFGPSPRGFGTWFQGEVSSNYAGSSGNTGNSVDRIELMLQPREDLSIGLQYWDLGKEDDANDRSATEVDLFALWSINDNWVFSPMVGYYKPDGSNVIASQGNDNSNLYLQGVLMYFY